MSLYAELPSFRARQVLADVLALAWILFWAWTGKWIAGLVRGLAEPGRALERAGNELARPLEDAGREVAGVPVVGEVLQRPLDAAAGAGRVLAQAGAGQQEAVHTLATSLGLLFALLPIALLLGLYLPGRLRWLSEASAARRLRSEGDLELFALRAATRRSLPELKRVSADPAGDLHAGRYGPLAALELSSLGLRAEPARAAPRDHTST